jgi:polyhydroxyalkanoate synthesis repressor PhaR
VTLADVRRLVVERVDFVVLDRKTQQDITRSILLQVIAEQEGGGESLMSRDFLSQVIRSYGMACRIRRPLSRREHPAVRAQQREIRTASRAWWRSAESVTAVAEEPPAPEGAAGRGVQPPAAVGRTRRTRKRG